MIPCRFVKQFLNRRLNDWRVYKAMTEAQVAKAERKLPRKPPWWDKLELDQKIRVLVGAYHPHFCDFSDPSTGKTLVALSLSFYFYNLYHLNRVLVLVPRRSNKDEWALQIEEHCEGRIACTVLRGTIEEKWHQLRSSNTLITVETYAGLTRMLGVPDGKHLYLVPELIDELRQTFQGFVLDESSMLGGGAAVDEQSLIFQICNKLADAFMWVELSGTPFGRDPSLLWSQLYLCDRGQTLGESLGIFKAAFFSKKDYWGKRQFLESRQKDLHRLLANRSIRFEINESLLPKRRHARRYVRMPEEQREWYERLYETFRLDPDVRRKENAFLRMRQLSSGFIGFVDDESGERAQIAFANNPKLEALSDMVLAIPQHYGVLIFYEFIWSGQQIVAELQRLGVSYLTLGGHTKDPEKVLRPFRNGEKQVLVINHRSGDFGLNLQNARYCIYYESPVSVIGRKQTERRILRRYSEHEWVAIIDLLMRGTKDDRVLEFHQEGESYFQAVLNGEEK